MPIRKPALALALALAMMLGLGGHALAQTDPRQAPVTPPTPSRPQTDPSLGFSPQPAAGSLKDYAGLLQDAQSQLETAIRRSGDEPAGNRQNAMTPARMDVKAAAQRVHNAMLRAPRELRDDAVYESAERSVRDDLFSLSQPLSLDETNGAARRVLNTVDTLRQKVEQRAGGKSG
ncbi:hypothetical protein E0493_04230 [Roseomonas sp. M0104]|uniref:DUF4168 domain-containing protein n=1 Tax=Teichococcus coralli TaxID=2545983 RepID=A0A845B8I7_9PROT|nr:hypothetical protein [Pseudoroseomonas coralli]MXP62560.1 hypothetical protein [Pseudoroseomonas coralli]